IEADLRRLLAAKPHGKRKIAGRLVPWQSPGNDELDGIGRRAGRLERYLEWLDLPRALGQGVGDHRPALDDFQGAVDAVRADAGVERQPGGKHVLQVAAVV